MAAIKYKVKLTEAERSRLNEVSQRGKASVRTVKRALSFHSLKHSRLLNQHRFRGIAKVRLHASLALLAYCATMLARVQAGQMDRMRIMRIRVPASAPPEQMRLAA